MERMAGVDLAPVGGDARAKTSTPLDASVPPTVAYETDRGRMYRGRTEDFLASDLAKEHRGKVQLILTSPPFPLNRKKKYGNMKGEAYVEWFASFAPRFRQLLKQDGSIVVELGNAWEPGQPVMSTLALRALLAFLERGEFKLCQQFIVHNPARLPSPAQWVNVERIRVKDAYTHVWWMSPTDRPFADNRQVLKPYSPAMEKLLRSKQYNAGRRPSQHNIGKKSFLTDNAGAIPSNVLVISNTRSSDPYLDHCREEELQTHPARMAIELPKFFINFLTRPRQLVLDPFGGSNTTGAAAEGLKRRWVAIEPRDDYIAGSRGWFADSLKGS